MLAVNYPIIIKLVKKWETFINEYVVFSGILDIHHGIAENWPFWTAHKRYWIHSKIHLQILQACKCSTYEDWSKLANCRFKDLASLKAGNLILYVGANTDGADGVELMKKCPHWWAKQKTYQTPYSKRTFAASFTFMSQFHHLTKYL